MKEVNFLKKLKGEGKLELVNPSEEMKLSYLIKAESFLINMKFLMHELSNEGINSVRKNFNKLFF